MAETDRTRTLAISLLAVALLLLGAAQAFPWQDYVAGTSRGGYTYEAYSWGTHLEARLPTVTASAFERTGSWYADDLPRNGGDPKGLSGGAAAALYPVIPLQVLGGLALAAAAVGWWLGWSLRLRTMLAAGAAAALLLGLGLFYLGTGILWGENPRDTPDPTTTGWIALPLLALVLAAAAAAIPHVPVTASNKAEGAGE